MELKEAKNIIMRMNKGDATEIQLEALNEVYEAIEKQIPKSVFEICGAMGEKYGCPYCGSSLTDEDVLAGHCKWCGQAIKN